MVGGWVQMYYNSRFCTLFEISLLFCSLTARADTNCLYRISLLSFDANFYVIFLIIQDCLFIEWQPVLDLPLQVTCSQNPGFVRAAPRTWAVNLAKVSREETIETFHPPVLSRLFRCFYNNKIPNFRAP